MMNASFLCSIAVTGLLLPAAAPAETAPPRRVLLDAHNCYPEGSRWTDRIDRALSTPTPLAIEQDLVWFTDPDTGKSWSIVSHGKPFTGREPVLRTHFFDRVRPIVEKALQDGDRRQWPLITLNLEFKTEEPEHLAAIWALLGEFESWLCTAPRVADADRVTPLDLKPILVLTGASREQQQAFHDAVPVGGRLRLFGAVHSNGESPEVPPEALVSQPATNYRRWWNNPWKVVEKDGQPKAGDWTDEDMRRLKALVDHAHANGLWIRFYTLNGYRSGPWHGWGKDYNFGSPARVAKRWQAAIDAGVDFVATDQYEDFAAFKARHTAQATSQ